MTVELLNSGSQTLFDELIQYPRVVHLMAMIDGYHPQTAAHMRRVGLLAIDLGLQNSLPPEQIRILGLGGLLHDIGKRGVPLELLYNPGPLSAEEWSKMQTHTRIGSKMLRDFRPEEVAQIALGHHRFQTSPYSNGRRIRISLDRISPGSIEEIILMVAVTDKFDALISPRPYKRAFGKNAVNGLLSLQFGNPDIKYISQLTDRAFPKKKEVS